MRVRLGMCSHRCRPSGRRRGASVVAAIGMVTGSLGGIIAITVITTSLASAGTPPPAPSGWTTVFSDDFAGPAGSAPNAATWFYDEGTGFGTGEIEDMTNSTANCSLDGNGDLKLTAIYSGGSWTSCRLESTRDDFYAPPGGELEMEASIEQPNPPNGMGYWPAFWALGSPMRAGGGWPQSGEIDMMEDVNALNEASQTLHDSANAPGHPLIACPTVGCQQGFNTYAVVIDRTDTSAEQMEFLMDGVVEDTITEASVGTTAWQDAIDHGFYIIWDLAMGGNYPNGECGCTTPTSSTSSGYSMLVNWVAVYETGSIGQACGQGCTYPATPTASGEVTGYDGLCLANENSNNTEGNPIGVAGCNGAANETWSVENNNSIEVQGGCLDAVAAGTTSGTKVDWYACNGTGAQSWTYNAIDEIVNNNSGLCLTVPGGNTSSQLDIATCTGASDQIWKVPTGGGSTTTTTAATTTTTAPAGANCSASTSGETALNESAFSGSSSTSGATGAQLPISNAMAGSSSGRFTTGAAQAPGMNYEVNMGSAQTFNEVSLNAPDYSGDYPRGIEVQVSPNGSTWTTVATCSPSAYPVTVSFGTQSAQYVQFVLTASVSPNWWSIEYFYAYNGSGTTTTTTAASTTTTAVGAANCSASASGETQLNESGFTGSSSISGSTGPQYPITNVLNGNTTGRFTSGAAQAPGMNYEVNMGSAQTFNEVELNAPDYPGDYPRGLNVEVSQNGASWSTVATCSPGSYPVTISFPPQSAQYVQVVLTASANPSWLSIEYFYVRS